MRRTILRELGFVVLLTISVYLLTWVTACSSDIASPQLLEGGAPIPAAEFSAPSCAVSAPSFQQIVRYDISY
jgi:hypothetical protein